MNCEGCRRVGVVNDLRRDVHTRDKRSTRYTATPSTTMFITR